MRPARLGTLLIVIPAIIANDALPSRPARADSQITIAPLVINTQVYHPENEWSQATSFCFGNVEIAGFPKRSISIISTQAGFSSAVEIRIAATSGHLRIHRSPATGVGGSCDYGKESNDGSILAGEIASLKIKASIVYQDGHPVTVVFPTGAVHARLRRSRDNLAPLDGGTLTFLGGDVDIENPEDRWIAKPASLTGALRVQPARARLSKAALLLPGVAAPASVTLESREKVAFDLDTATGKPRLFDGTMAGLGSTVSLTERATDLALPRLTLRAEALAWGRTELTARKGSDTFTIQNLTVRAATASYASEIAATMALGGPMQIGTLEARKLTHGDALTLGDVLLKSIAARARDLRVRAPDGRPIATLSADLAVDELSDAHLVGHLVAGAISEMKALPSGLAMTGLAVSFDTRSSRPTLTGELTLGALPLGALWLRDVAARWQFQYVKDWTFTFQVQARTGQVSVYRDPSRSDELYRAALTRFSIEGTANVLPASGGAALRIEPDKLHLALDQITTLRPAVLGGRLVFPAGTLEATNREVLLATGDTASGSLQLTTPSVRIERVALTLDPARPPVPTSAQLDGSDVTVGLTIQEGGLRLIDADLHAKAFEVAPDTPIELRAAGVRVTVRRMTIDQLHVSYARGAGAFQLKTVSLDALAFARDDASPYLAGRVTQPIAFESLSGEFAPVGGSGGLALQQASMSHAVISLADLSYRAPDKLQLSGASAQLELQDAAPDHLSCHLRINGGSARLAGSVTGEIALTSADLQLETRAGKHTGTGTIALGPAAASVEVGVPLQLCGDKLPLVVNVGTPGGSGRVDIDDHGLRLRLETPTLDAHVSLARAFQCQWNQHVMDIPEVRVPYWYPCGVLPPKVCQGWATVVPHISVDVPMLLRIFHLTTSARVTSTVIQAGGERGFTLCGGHLDAISPPAPGAVLFHVNPHIPGGLPMRIVQAPIDAAVGALESTVLQVLGDVAALLNSAGLGRQWSIFGGC